MLMRTDPFRDLDRLAQQVLGTPARPAAMPIDAYRHGDEFVVEFDLPGVDPDSIDLTVEKNVLTVHAERRRHDARGRRAARRRTARRAPSAASCSSATASTPTRIDASYADGVLTLRLPVAEKAKPRRVPINVADEGATTAIDAHVRGARRTPVART